MSDDCGEVRMPNGPNPSGRGRRMIRTSSRAVRSGMSYHLAELNRVLPTIRRAVDGLDALTPSETFDRAADQMWRGVLVAREIASSATRTGCAEHPDGPEDPEPPENWSRCLICNIRRKRGTQNHRGFNDDHVRRRAPDKRDLIELVPIDVHQGLRELRDTMRDIDDRAFNLHLESPSYERDALADAMLRGFTLLRELARPVSLTGCVKHPEGAVDPAPPPGWGKCLHCNTEWKRRTKGYSPLDSQQMTRLLPPSNSQAAYKARRDRLPPHPDQPTQQRPRR